MDDIPQILKIELFRRHDPKCRHTAFEIDYQNKTLYCQDCKEMVDPYRVVELMIQDDSIRIQRYRALREEVRKLEQYKPWLKAVRELESVWRGSMLPCCPHCSKGVEAVDLLKMKVNREYAKLRLED